MIGVGTSSLVEELTMWPAMTIDQGQKAKAQGHAIARMLELITEVGISLLQRCLWNQLPSSLRQPHIPVPLSPACSRSYHIFSSCQPTTPTIHISLSLPVPAQDQSLSQILPAIDSLPASGLTPRTLWLDRFFWASRFLANVNVSSRSLKIEMLNRWCPYKRYLTKKVMSE